MQPDAKSPAGADIRYLVDGEIGKMIHSTVPPHQINKAMVREVTQIWQRVYLEILMVGSTNPPY
jgi:hypothetical protein